MLHKFDFIAPRERADLLSLLAEHGRSAMLLAGGTDALVNIRAGTAKPSIVLDLKRVPGWHELTWDAAEGLTLRPGTTLNQVLEHPVVRKRFPLLVAGALDLASHQLRNRATVLGNIVNASPAADMAPALLCLGARAHVASIRGEREMALEDFFTGVKRTAMAPDEMLERIVVPAAWADARGDYKKLKRINGHDLGIVGVALAKHRGAMTLGMSAAAPRPVLVKGLREDTPADDVVAAALAAIKPISDLRCSREYREHMVEVFTRRLLQEVH